MEGVFYMRKPTMCIVWPIHIDYPIFRYMLKKNVEFFKDIVIVFSDGHVGYDFRNFIKYDLPFAHYLKPYNKKSDWRDDAVYAITHAYLPIDYFLFIEQDFLIGHGFWQKVLTSESPFIYYNQDGRIHPAFSIISRELVDKTSCDFSAHPDDGYDHFGKFFTEIKALENGVEIRELGLENKKDFYHMNGLTQNYFIFHNGGEFYNKEEFITYNYQSMLLPHQCRTFYKTELDIAEKYGLADIGFINNFFPDYESPV